MRSLRWLLLVFILAMIGGVAVSYRHQRREERRTAPAKPTALPLDTNASGIDFSWGENSAGKPQVQLKAKALRQTSDMEKAELEAVELRIFQKDGKHYDLVKSPRADFNQREGKMSSNTEVEITLEVPTDGKPLHPLTSVKTSGLTYESKSGKAVTDKPARFTFENGDGTCVGATYDPASKELHLLKDVVLNMRGAGPKSKPMKVETAELIYKEGQSVISLAPWAKMTRAETTVDAGATVLNLKEKRIQSIDAQKAHGVDNYPKRKLDYAADLVHVAYNESGEVEKVVGTGNARLNSESAGSQIHMSSSAVDLDFTEQEGESILTKATATGKGVLESKPAPAKDGKTPPTRVLRSEAIEMQMRQGGKEIEVVRTHTPGVLEFVPNRPEERRRVLNAARMTMTYGPQNIIRSFQAANVTTETFPLAVTKPDVKGAPSTKAREVARTSSVNMTADFDEKGQMKRLKQWEKFTYQEGERKARAENATMESDQNVIDLETGARVWDDTSSTSGDHIHLTQNTGDFTADGHVNTSRLPDKKGDKSKTSSEMLDGDEPTQGMAQKMTSANRNHLVHYEGNAVLWQGANRIQADKIDIDRDQKTLLANGSVVTQFIDKAKEADDTKRSSAPQSPAGASVFTIVKAAHLVYSEENRLAHYTGAVTFNRPGLFVKSEELQAFLNPKDANAESRINKAYADTKVEIVQTAPDRKRTGTGEHAEYYTEDDRIILRGAPEALLADSKRGDTRGAELTYFADDDRLLVNGAPGKPVKSRLRKK